MHLKRHSWALSGEILSFCRVSPFFGPVCFRPRQTGGLTDRQLGLMQACEDQNCHVSSVQGHDLICPKITSCSWTAYGKQTSSHGRSPPEPGFLDVIKHHRMFSLQHRTLGKEEMEGRPDTTDAPSTDPMPGSLSTSAGHE